MSFDPTDPAAVRDLSWIGDALLSLFAREWIFEHEAQLGGKRAELYRDLTCNQFLSALGEPSVAEARIGDAYRAGGLPAAQKYSTKRSRPSFSNSTPTAPAATGTAASRGVALK